MPCTLGGGEYEIIFIGTIGGLCVVLWEEENMRLYFRLQTWSVAL